jgi:hypothetical protein
MRKISFLFYQLTAKRYINPCTIFKKTASFCLFCILYCMLYLRTWTFYIYLGYTDKKENQIFLIFKEMQSGAVAKLYMRKGFLIHEECANISPYMRRPLVIYDFAIASFWISLYMMKVLFSFYQCTYPLASMFLSALLYSDKLSIEFCRRSMERRSSIRFWLATSVSNQLIGPRGWYIPPTQALARASVYKNRPCTHSGEVYKLILKLFGNCFSQLPFLIEELPQW